MIAALDDVWLERGDRAVLRGVTLRLQPGERLALVGPNGAGKTSLLRVLAGLEAPTRGQVVPVPRGAGYAPQSAVEHLFPWFSPLRNVALGALIARRPAALEEARAALATFAPSLERRRTSWGLSGGEAQALALARALCCPGPVALLDEPFSALSDGARERLRARFAAALGARALVLVTHQLEDARALGARVVRLDAGRLVEATA